MYLVVLGVLLLVLKLTDLGPVAGMPWWAVLLPFGLAVLWWAWADASGWTKRREMDKMERKKKRPAGQEPRRPGNGHEGPARAVTAEAAAAGSVAVCLLARSA